MLACINEWIILQRRTKITISPVPFKSLLRALAPVKYISILRHTKNFKKFLGFNLDTAYICISPIKTMLYNTDTNSFGHITQQNGRRGIDEELYQV